MNKAVFIFCLAFSLFATYSFAQEVHGIETKKVCIRACNPDGTLQGYENNTPGYYDQYRDARYSGDYYYPYYAFKFTNMNTFTASVEAELYRDEKLVDTKYFVLKSNESYDWKPFDGKGCWAIYDYYVKYKAYKLQ